MPVVPMKDEDMVARLRAVAKQSQRKRGPRCLACCLPGLILEAVRQLRSEGMPLTAICAALKNDGRDIPVYSMTRHFREHEQG